MKKKLLIIIGFLLLTRLCFSSPDNSISIPNSFSANTTISSSATNSNNNEVQTKFNAHSHTDITQTGTITSGTWQGSVIDETYGGLGSNFSSTAQGNIFYFSGTGTVATLAPGTTDYPLVSNGSGANPAYEQLATAGIADLAVTNAKIAASTIDLTAKVTGTLPVANGGTNSTALQYGIAASSGSDTTTISLSPAFPDTTYTVVIGTEFGSTIGEVLLVKSKGTGSFQVQNTNAAAITINYLAINY